MNDYERLQQGHYGSMELKNHLGQYLFTGLIVSFLIHTLLIGTPYMLGLFTNQSIRQIPIVLKPVFPPSRPMPETLQIFRTPPPSITAPIEKFAKPISVDKEDISETTSVNSPTTHETVGDVNPEGTGEPSSFQIPGNFPIDDPIPDFGVFIPREVEPIALETNPQPIYPEIAKLSGVSGRVRIQLFVDKNGNVKQYFILPANPKDLGFEEAVEKVITKWKFTPALQQGSPVGVWISIPFNFKVKK